MRLENFEPLFIAMNQVGEKKQRFTIEYNGVRAHVLFLADVEPFLLIFGIQGTNEYFELEMNQDFEVNSFFAKELYRKLIEIFNIQYDPDHKFTPNDFLSFVNNNVPEFRMDLSQYLGHILVETVMSFFLLPNLQTPEGLDSESNYEVDSGYKIPQYS